MNEQEKEDCKRICAKIGLEYDEENNEIIRD